MPLITYRKIGVSLLLIALIFQTFNKTFLVGDYYLNTKDYIANCENKANITMHCDGKCQLSKKIKKQQESEKKNQEKRGENHSEFYFFNSYSNTLSTIVVMEVKPDFGYLPNEDTLEWPHFIFKPPIS